MPFRVVIWIVVMLRVIILCHVIIQMVIMLSVSMLSVVLLSVTASKQLVSIKVSFVEVEHKWAKNVFTASKNNKYFSLPNSRHSAVSCRVSRPPTGPP